MAMGGRGRRGLREHRSDPTTSLTSPAADSSHDPENRSPAAPGGPASYPRTVIDSSHAAIAVVGTVMKDRG